jgi:hypothetical protein
MHKLRRRVSRTCHRETCDCTRRSFSSAAFRAVVVFLEVKTKNYDFTT